MSTIDNRDLKKGEQGEDFFKNIAARFLFSEDLKARDTVTGECFSIADLRKTMREGEFALPDGSLIEVKSDFKCYQTGNIITELSGRNNDVGWFQHCQTNGIQYVIYLLYRGTSKRFPYRDVMFSFDRFASYVNRLMNSEQYMRRNIVVKPDKDGSQFKILKINLEDAIRNCNPIIAYTQECQQDIMSILIDSINQVGKRLGMKIDNASDLNSCVIQYACAGKNAEE